MSSGISRRPRRSLHRAVLLTATAALTLGAVAVAPAQAAPVGPASAPQPRVQAPRVATAEVTAGLLAGETGLTREQAKQRLAAQAKQAALADRLTRGLGARSGGAYFERGGKLVVTVTDAKAGAAVTKAGAKARLVKHSAAKLDGVKAVFDRVGKGVVGSSFAVDPVANKVVVAVPRSAPKAATLAATAARYGDAVRLTRTDRTVATASDILGGDAIWHSSGGRCSAGFNVWNGATRYVLTAGHCTALGGIWTNWDGAYLGPSVGSYFPGQDHGLIRIDGPVAQLPGVYLYNGYYQPITGAAYAYAGQYACKSGSTTGYTCGSITATNVTINYAQGPVYGAIQGNICVQPGDSGGALHSGGTALGIVSGYQPGTCVGFFQQVVPALNYWGVSLI